MSQEYPTEMPHRAGFGLSFDEGTANTDPYRPLFREAERTSAVAARS